MLRGIPDSAAVRAAVRALLQCVLPVRRSTHLSNGSPIRASSARAAAFHTLGHWGLRVPALVGGTGDCKCTGARAQLRHQSAAAAALAIAGY